MEKILEQALLYDFYGELLTDHQKQIYEDVVLNDFSLSEVAAERGISRQGVHDLIKRCNKLLNDYEEKLHLVERFIQIREKVHQIEALTRDYHSSKEEALLLQVTELAGQILEDL